MDKEREYELSEIQEQIDSLYAETDEPDEDLIWDLLEQQSYYDEEN